MLLKHSLHLVDSSLCCQILNEIGTMIWNKNNQGKKMVTFQPIHIPIQFAL